MSIAKKIHGAMRTEGGLGDVLMVAGGGPMPIPDTLEETIAAEGHHLIPDDMDAAEFHCALGFAWALATLEDPFMAPDDMCQIAVDAATNACVAMHGGNGALTGGAPSRR